MSEESTATADAPADVSTEVSTESTEANAPWYGDLSESLSAHKTFYDQFKDRDSFFKSAADTKAAYSRKIEGMVKLPTAESTPEEIQAFYVAQGVPETPDAYEITPPVMPEGFDWNPDAISASIKEAAHKNGVTPQALSALVQAQAQVEAEQIAEYHAQEEAAIAALKTEWGGNYDKNVMLATKAAGAGGLAPDNPILGNPDVQRVLANLGAKISEGSLGSIAPAAPGLNSKDEAQEIIRNPEHPLHSAYHGKIADRDKIAKARSHVADLFKKAATT